MFGFVRLASTDLASVFTVSTSPTSYEATVGFTDECPAVDRAGLFLPQESQVSQLSSVQLSPNRVQEDYDFDTIDVFPMYAASPRNDGYFPSVSPISSPDAMNTLDSTVTLATGSVMHEVTGSFDSAVGSLVTSLSITDYAADFTLVVGTIDFASGTYVAQTCTGPGTA